MSAFGRKQYAFESGKKGSGAMRTQFGALCYRMSQGKPQVLLITSRTTRRWIIPKGWPIKGLAPEKAAAQEAWEEAGVRGKVKDLCAGVYGYTKIGEKPGEADLPCMVAVFPLKVKSLASVFPERKERKRRWFTPKQASKRVQEAELREILANFDPRALR